MDESTTPESTRSLSRRGQLGLALALALLLGGTRFNARARAAQEAEWKLQGLSGEFRLAFKEQLVAELRAELVRSHPELARAGDEHDLQASRIRTASAEAQILDHFVNAMGRSRAEAKAYLAWRRTKWEAAWHGRLIER